MSEGAVIVGGELWPCAARVRTWHESGGLQFPVTKTRSETRVVVLHWTGAENPPEALHRNMVRAGLAVHFVIDQEGRIWQMMDADRFGAHCAAHGANSYSVGVELINRGSGLDLPDKGVLRPELSEIIHGKAVRYAGFTYLQMLACLALTETLCRAYALPMVVPLRGKDVLPTAMTLSEARRWRGCAGHFQFEPGKVDPGLELLRAVQTRGALSPGPKVA